MTNHNKQNTNNKRRAIRVSRKPGSKTSSSKKTTHIKKRRGRKQFGQQSKKYSPLINKRIYKEQPPKKQKTKQTIPEPGKNLRIVPLGGVEEIGKNMTVLEYKDEIIVIDAGFQFSQEETPGIDYIIPNVTYLEDRKEKVRAVFITHGHLDHIGAIPYVMPPIGNPPIYSREFGAALIKKRQSEFSDFPKLDLRTVQGNETIKIGKHFIVKFFSISHAIPDSMGLIIKTPVGTVIFVEDVRVDNIDGKPTEKEKKQWGLLKNENVVLFTLDSTSIEKPGFSLSESVVFKNVEPIIKNVSGRLIIGMFASQAERLIEFIRLANKYNKKVVVDGRSMKTNLEVIKELRLLKLENVVSIEEMKDYPPNKVVVIATGAQGEEYSVFDRIGNNTHKYIKLNKTDTILFSASVVPGNETSVQKLKDNLYRHEAKIITYRDAEVHSSGHGNRGELKWIHEQVNYKFFVPLHGHHFMLRMHAEMVMDELGVSKKNIIIPDNGSIIEITPNGEKIFKRQEEAPSSAVMVDGFSVSDKQEVVLRDRKMLAEEGMFVVVISIDPRTGKIRKSPDIIARGFVYLRESQQLLDETRAIVKRTVENITKGMHPINFDYVKNAVTDEIRKHLFQKTGKSPIVIPVIIGV